MSAQMRLIFTGLAFTILISLYISQQSINCYHFMQMTDEEMRYDYADDSEEFEYSSSQMPRAKAIRKEPYNCGVLFFYHIPSTGGSSSEFLIVLSCRLPSYHQIHNDYYTEKYARPFSALDFVAVNRWLRKYQKPENGNYR